METIGDRVRQGKRDDLQDVLMRCRDFQEGSLPQSKKNPPKGPPQPTPRGRGIYGATEKKKSPAGKGGSSSSSVGKADFG